MSSRATDRSPAGNGEAARSAGLWRALAGVPDPEIPIVSVVELGIVRGVARADDGWVITLTPTYSGCPATRVIVADVSAAAVAATHEPVRVVTELAPPWSTDWIAPEARRRLREAGIAPPQGDARAASPACPIAFRHRAPVRCPRCGSSRTAELARFGSTPCKAQYRCDDCLEPFDYFKPH